MNLRTQLLSQSGMVFAGRLFGAGLIFLVQAAMARLWGADVLGDYLLIIASVNLVAVVLPLGFETIGTYFAAEYRARGEGSLLRGFMLRAYAHIVVVAAVVSLLCHPIAATLGDAGAVLAAHWAPAMVMAVAAAVVYVNSALLVGLKHPVAGFFSDGLFRPMLVVVAFAAASLSGAGDAFGLMVWLVAAGFSLIALGQFAYMVRQAARVPASAPARSAEPARWWRFAIPWVVIALATDYLFDLDLLLLSGHLERAELAIFGVCTRIFALVSFGVAAVYAVTLPDVFESEALSDRSGFHRKIGDANLVATGIAAILFVIAVAFGPILLGLFGPEFEAGSGPLAILCLALVVRAAFGPASLVLSIHDRPYASLPAIGLGLLTLMAGNMLLVPPYGLMGAAVAALVAISVWSAALWLTARLAAGVDVSIVKRLRNLPAAAAPRSGAA